MEKITLKDYLKIAFDKKYPLKYNWAISMLTKITGEDNYIISDPTTGKILIKLDGENRELEGNYKGRPIILPEDPIRLEKGYIANISEDIDTTVGRLLANYFLLTENFGDLIPYQNRKFTVGDIEDDFIRPLLVSDKDATKGKISVTQYVKFVDSSMAIRAWSTLILVASTPKTEVEAPGIRELKDKLIKEAIKEHGPRALEDYTVIAGIDKKLSAYDDEWLKDDPSEGRGLDKKKVKANSRRKRLRMIGAEKGFKQDNKAINISHTLADGYGTNPDHLVELFNSARFGSYSRGVSTAEGGVVAKITLRATNSLTIVKGNCGSNIGYDWYVAPNNLSSIVGRAIITGPGKYKRVSTVEEAKQYAGKHVEIRSPSFCLGKGETICEVCMAEALLENPTGISLVITGVGGTILNMGMKGMHDTTVKVAEVDVDEVFS